MFVKVLEKQVTKTVLIKGCGFNSPLEGSVCKIKIIQDEANLLSDLTDDKIKEITIGDVDKPFDRIIEDCVRTMKEKEECYVEFPLPVRESITVENSKIDTSVDSSKVARSCVNNPDNLGGDSKFHTQNASNTETESIDVKKTSLVKIQIQLLSFTNVPEVWEMDTNEKWQRACYHKEKGLELYTSGLYQCAFRRFGVCIKYLISLEHDAPLKNEDIDIKGLKLSCYLNLAACQMKHPNFESVVKNSSKALKLQPNNAKALYRRGSAYVQLQEYEKAEEDLKAALQLEPKNQAIVKQLQVLKSRVQKLNEYYSNRMKKMFS